MLPSITVTGGLVREPDLRFSGKGKAWAAFRLVAKDRVRDNGGAWVDGDPLFIDVVCFGSFAENLAESALKPGTLLTVTGTLQDTSYEKDGAKVAAYGIKADEVAVSLRFKAFSEKEVARATASDDPWAANAPTDHEPPF